MKPLLSRKKATFSPLFVVAALAAARCRSGETPRKTAIPTADGGVSPEGRRGPARQDALGSIYPASIEPLAVARDLCDALHALPAERGAACCGTTPDRGLGEPCVRALSASLRDGAVELDEASVAACRAAMERALAGCDWVTPAEPLAPSACQRLLRGKLGAGSGCRSSLECAGDLHCEGLGPTRTGICAAPAARGEGCGSHLDVLATYTLERGLATTHPFCAEHCSLVTHRCEALPELGSRCFSAVNCAPGQTCVAGACSSAAPAPLAAAGETCATDLDCAIGGCGRRADAVRRRRPADSLGEKTCGAKCSPSFEALEHSGSVRAMALPARPAPSEMR